MAQRIEWNETRVKCIAQEEKPGRNFTFALVRPSWFPSSRESWKAKEEEEGKEKKKGKTEEKINDIGRCDWMERRRKNPPFPPSTRRTCNPSPTDSAWFLFYF